MSWQLLILRHGQAAGGAVDFDRVLTEKGIVDARHAGQWLRAQALLPDKIISSPAVRTRQTVQYACEAMAADINTDWPEAFYNADSQTLIEAIMRQDESCRRLLLVGHNPGVSVIATSLTGRSISLSPASLAVLELDAPWPELSQANIRLLQQR